MGYFFPGWAKADRRGRKNHFFSEGFAVLAFFLLFGRISHQLRGPFRLERIRISDPNPGFWLFKEEGHRACSLKGDPAGMEFASKETRRTPENRIGQPEHGLTSQQTRKETVWKWQKRRKRA
jgi:hypothetical protein